MEQNIELIRRVDELETRLAFHEDTMAQLNDVIAQQDAEIRALKAQFEEVLARYQDIALQVFGDGDAADDKPPHY
ncbi:SlyX family protein [Microbulbifer sp. 2201CG32-9]|uniref:SlyX family protein n=1 Tax=Microbulbifer sp. 2201CG32-9 TaxID=3232309 RepID=UPI00345B93C0